MPGASPEPVDQTLDPLLVQIAQTVGGQQTLETLTRPLLEMLQAITGLESTYLTTIDLAKGEQHILYARNAKAMQIPEGVSFPWHDTLCKRALDEGRMCTSDVPSTWGDCEAAAALGIRTYVSCAVRASDGALFGTLCAASADSLQLAPNADRVLGMFSSLIGQHVEREVLVNQLRDANAKLASFALTDMLTDLPNRRALVQELTRALARCQRDGSALLVAFIDLDDFKQVNDRHGHEAGDHFLVAIAGHLRANLRAGDVVGRLGGDEFVVVAQPSSAGDAAAGLREHLARLTIGRFSLGVGLHLDYQGASVGVVRIEGGVLAAEDVLVRADAAMYENKRARKTCLPSPDPALSGPCATS